MLLKLGALDEVVAVGLHALDNAERAGLSGWPRSLRWLAGVVAAQAVAVGAFGDAGQAGEPRNRQTRCRSQGFDVGEGTSGICSAPLRQIRSCTVASAKANLSCSFSRRIRRSTTDSRGLVPGGRSSSTA
jgi:hypothetical protein